jgi:hypothetical protein
LACEFEKRYVSVRFVRSQGEIVTRVLTYHDTMTEKQLQDALIGAAKATGWLVYHVFDSRRSTPGFPDLVLLKGKRCMVLELKTAKGRVRPEQRAWLAAFTWAGIDARLVRPDDLETVLQELSEGSAT